MKKTILLFSSIALITLSVNAQPKASKAPVKKTATAAKSTAVKKAPVATKAPIAVSQAPVPAPAMQPATPAQNPDLNIKFPVEEHSFGNVPEGPAVTYDFEFKNIGKEPIVLSNVQASCGCTTPSWPKEPIAPGKTGKIAVTYNTQGRPGPIMKTVTVSSNIGTKVLKITGNVEKAPESSVPANNNSMMKH